MEDTRNDELTARQRAIDRTSDRVILGEVECIGT